ncbi:MAG: hypothetical protein B1H09_00590 [Gemmatimonadaceae bacterium 4484_173]|nr:MAG: hypothetical protein B1H09_00590 [Gemmatimonadaceae bacterium 4484_173]
MGKLISLILVVSVSLVFAEEPVVTILENGLTVVTQELHYAPVVATTVTYDAGSRNESQQNLGISHFCEHMMFKGTTNMPEGRFWQIIQRDGGYSNAQEGVDVTYYYLLLPASRVEDALMIESDRMVNCIMDSAEVASESNVVHEERRMSAVDDPDGALSEALYEMAYTYHPYRNPVTGYGENILEYNKDMVSEFYSTYYCPSNAVLSAVGDFETQELLDQIENYFGDIPAGNVPEETIPDEPVQSEPGYTEIEHNSNLQRLAVSFHSTSGTDPMNPAMIMISAYLYNGRSGKLNELLVETGLVSSVRVRKDNRIDPGLFTVYVTMNPPGNSSATADEIVELIWQELDNLTANGIPEDELDQLRNSYRAREIQRGSNPLALSIEYSRSYSLFRNPMYYHNLLEQLEQLTTQDIRMAASAYFKRNAVNVAMLVPVEEEESATGSQGAELPTGDTEPATIEYEGLEIPDEFLTPPVTSIADGVQSFQLENGLQLLVKEDHTFPITSVGFAIPMGSLMNPDSLDGLATVVSKVMMQGTDELDYIEFHQRLESEGSYMAFYTRQVCSIGYLSTLSEDIDIAFSTVSDLLIRAAFRESDFNRVISEQYTGLDRSAENVLSCAYNNLIDITANDRRVSRESLSRITLNDAENFYSTCCRPRGSVIVVAGDICPEEALRITENYFGEWTNPAEPPPQPVTPVFSSAPGDTIYSYMPGRTQTAVLVACRAPGMSSPDYPAFSIMNTVLGDGIGSRLGHSIRDEQGLAYGVGTWLTSTKNDGSLTAYLTTLSDYAPMALSTVIHELELINSENVLDIELRLAQASAVGTIALSGMTYRDLSYGLAYLAATGRPLNWNNSYLNSVLELTPDQIRDTVARYMTPEQWFVSIAGSVPEDEILPDRFN